MNLITTVISTSLDSFKRRLVKFYITKNNTQECKEAGPFGFDSNPFPKMKAIYAATAAKGRPVIIGYINLDQAAELGESRMYAMNGNREIVTFLWAKANGDILLGGDAKTLIQYEAMKTAFDQLKVDLNAARAALSLPPSTADMSAAQLTKLKTA